MTKAIKLLALILLLSLAHESAWAQGRTRSGVLNCRLAPSIGLVIGSRQRMSCVFNSDTGWSQRYRGTLNRIGLDVGFTTGGNLTWLVLGHSSAVQRGALRGRFVGASGDASFGLGLGANVLVGGTARGISLQPLSVQGQTGVNLAVGVAGLTLTPQ